ncbi:MAG: tRNA (adenosine(37)-N6)-threonylcarbamoyltransferase complex dimerization subunit type 1 TsaB [Clostridiales Family XIII bacterium]|jgi:tRNA threonylcarbamoyladenosine biosynthesis protein TsaB|nr:tRNA (adenosine(37)-N6)-threonylcarbamoyltransferase complex dimerization subunit type 1 TsaB [Clostridiales Family XIII bacterium]
MLILAIDTTGNKASVAIGGRNGVIAEERANEDLNHLKGLTLMADAIIKGNGYTYEDVKFIAVSEGPGSFTGIRIGVSTARALAQAWGLQTVSVPTLTSFVHNAPGYGGIVCPLFDARREQVYCGLYRLGQNRTADGAQSCLAPLTEFGADIYGEAEILAPGAARSLGEIRGILEVADASRTDSEVMFFGDGLDRYAEDISEWASGFENLTARFAEGETRYQRAASIIKMAYGMIARGETVSYDALKPVYLRKAEAERKLEQQRLTDAK